MIDSIPEKLLIKAQNLQCIGSHELAWEYNTVPEVLQFLNDNNYVILGGDVYKVDECGQIFSTGDNWYFINNCITTDVSESNRTAMEYIEYYHKKNGAFFYYSMVCVQV